MPSNVKRYGVTGWTMVSDWDDLVADVGAATTALNNYKATDLATHVSAGAPPVFPTAINGIIPKNNDLYINKTNMTLYQAVGSTWGAVLGTWVGSPAFVGARGDSPDQAKFSHSNFSPNAVGFTSQGDGTNLIINAQAGFNVLYDYNAGAYREYARLSYQNFKFSPWEIGMHPTHAGYPGIWLQGDNSGGNYALLKLGGMTLINGSTSVEIRVGNATKLTADANGVTFTGAGGGGGGAISASSVTASGGISAGTDISAGGSVIGAGIYGSYLSSSGAANVAGTMTGGVVVSNGNVQGRCVGDGNWPNWQIIANPVGGAYSVVGCHVPGVAASGWRVHSSQGGQLSAVNESSTNYVHTASLQHFNMSTITQKRDVRSLRPERERIAARLNPASDEVALPDVMALRPVAFRSKVPAHHPDGSEWDGIIGNESKRERIGLIAEETQHVIPSAVSHDVDGNAMGIDYAQITTALLDHVQQLTTTIETLTYRLTELERKEDK